MRGETILVTRRRSIIPAGIKLELTNAQAQTRRMNLVEIDDGIYEVIKPIEFKRGEVITIMTAAGEPEPTPAIIDRIIEPSDEKPKKETPKVEKKNKKKTETPAIGIGGKLSPIAE